MGGESPTDVLRKEHEKVLKILVLLENCLEKKDAKKLETNIALLEKEFELHSLNKEEKVLFPEIEKFIARDNGPTGVMIAEHRQLVESIKEFKEALKAKDSEKLAETGKSIIYTLRPHIDKENEILFMIADMHLDEKQKKTVLRKFKNIDSKK